MGNALAEGVAARSKIALWLLKERFPDWELALIGVSECHSVLEALWHGVDERHPLHSHSSSRAAAEGVHKVYQAIDQLVGTLTAEFEDATDPSFQHAWYGAEPFRCAGHGAVARAFTPLCIRSALFLCSQSLGRWLPMVFQFSAKRTIGMWSLLT